MNEFETVHLLWGIGALVLVISALSIRRANFGSLVRALLAWVLIFGVIFLVVDRREDISRIARQGLASVGMAEQRVEGGEVRIRRAGDGHYWATVTLTGPEGASIERRMLVDSGATLTVLSRSAIEDLGIQPIASPLPVIIETAAGRMTAQRARVPEVAIGDLTMRNLDIVVLPDPSSQLDVIGMNFLSQLHGWRVEQGTLILQPDPPADPADAETV